METFWKFDRDQKHKNWLKAIVVLRRLQELLESFIDRQIDIFHRTLRRKCDLSLCGKKCDFKNWKPRPNQIPPFECEVCSRWRDAIRSYHTSPGGKVMWMNSEPNLWSQNKWEVAKVYMAGGHKNHRSIGDFDIAALLSLMTQCKHFKTFELGDLCAQVANVRNNIMHSASFQLKQEDVHNYLGRIKALGEVLARHDPEFESLSGDIDVIQNLDFRLILPNNMAAEEVQAQHGKELEDTLFAAVQFEDENQKTRTFSSRVHRAYWTKLRRQEEMIAQRDRDILHMHSEKQAHRPHVRTTSMDTPSALEPLPIVIGTVILIFMSIFTFLKM